MNFQTSSTDNLFMLYMYALWNYRLYVSTSVVLVNHNYYQTLLYIVSH